MSQPEEPVVPSSASASASASAPTPARRLPVRLRFETAADHLEALLVGLHLSTTDAPRDERLAFDRAVEAAARAARRRGVALPLHDFLVESRPDPIDRALFLALLRAGVEGKCGGGLDHEALAAAVGARGLSARLDLRARLEERSALRVPGVLESDDNDVLEERLYRLAPDLVERLAPASRARPGKGERAPRPDQLFAAFLVAAGLLSSLASGPDRREHLWTRPSPGGGWDRGASARALLARQIAALRESGEPVGRLFAEPGLGETEALVLALLVEASLLGKGPVAASVLAALTIAEDDPADPLVLLGRSGRLVASGLAELPAGEEPFFLRTLALSSAAFERLGLPVSAPEPAKRATGEEEGGPALEVSSPSHRLADVVLSPADRARVEELLFRLGEGEALLKDWGFGSAAGGAAALLYGPPGTGKTFTAEALAAELGRPLARLRIEGALSRWVGTSEQRVAAAFRDAAAAGAVLLLDEADALLVDRADARSWQVPLVNILLVEIERYPGLVVLATNRAAALDPALERRLSLRLELLPPGEAERAELWRRHLPAGVPLAADVDFPALARAHALTGAGIRRACTQAALRAARRPDAARRIDQADLAAAAAEGAAPAARPLGFRPAPAPRPEPRKLSVAA